jgi:hypothetical protein
MNKRQDSKTKKKDSNKVEFQEGAFKSLVFLWSQEEFCEHLPLPVNIYGQVFHLLKCQHRRKAPESYTLMCKWP